jgi:hypothetical protein
VSITKRGRIDHPWRCEKWASISSGYRRLSAGVLPDSGRQSNVGMLAVGDGPPIGGGWGTIHGGCTLAFLMFAG